MVFLAGECRAAREIATLRRLGWGRMAVEASLRPYPGEPWAFDNGAFGAWKRGEAWDDERDILADLWEQGWLFESESGDDCWLFFTAEGCPDE